MAYMKSFIAFGLFWVNLIVASSILYFSITVMNSDYLNRSSYNLRGTKERLVEINPNYLKSDYITSSQKFNCFNKFKILIKIINVNFLPFKK